MRKDRIKKMLIALGAIMITTMSYAADFTREQLDDLRSKNLISQEDYEIFLLELGEGNFSQEVLYSLRINGKLTNSQYKIDIVGNSLFLPVYSFMTQLELKNFTDENGVFNLKIGEELRDINIDFNKKSITYAENKIKVKFDEVVKRKDGEIYLRKDVFQTLFLESLEIDEANLSMNMRLNFNPPNIIEILLDKNQRELEQKKKEKELIFKNKEKLFELGNAKLELDYIYSRNSSDKKIDRSVEGEVSYQGSLLYGDLITGYRTEENELKDTYLRYSDSLISGHDLELGSYSIGKAREWGISLKKNRGYFENGERNFVIEDNVPVGSRVELLYLGAPIEIQDAENGRVRFENSLIESDKTYFLKIYSPDGKIEMREIYTAETYNQQNKGEIEYDINFRENHESGDIESNSSIYYGISDKLTLGIGYDREIEDIDDKYEALNVGTLELLYSDFIKNRYGYTFEVRTERTLDDLEDSDGKNYKDRYTDEARFQIDINKFTFTLNGKQYGDYETELKNSYSLFTEYRVTDNLKLEYDIERENYKEEKSKDISSFMVDYDYRFKDLLTTTRGRYSEDKERNEVSFEVYYSGLVDNTISLENNWSGEDMDYEASLKMYSSTIFGMLDYNFELSYSEREKEKVTFGFTLRYDNFFEFTSELGDMGTRNFSAGIDTVMDLRSGKILRGANSVETSNLKVTAFVDENNNDIFDEGEKRVERVSIGIGKETVETDKNGVAYFTGLPNSVLLDLKPSVKKPNYTFGDNKIKVIGRGTSTIEAYIPIKPMMTLTGLIDFAKNLKISEEEKIELYENLIVKISDKNGEVVELTVPDETGVFMVSGLFTENYKVEIEYVGDKFNIPTLKEDIKLAYNDNEANQEIVFQFSKNRIVMNR